MCPPYECHVPVPVQYRPGAVWSVPGTSATGAHFMFPGCEGDSLLLLLDAQGIECSTSTEAVVKAIAPAVERARVAGLT